MFDLGSPFATPLEELRVLVKLCVCFVGLGLTHLGFSGSELGPVF